MDISSSNLKNFFWMKVHILLNEVFNHIQWTFPDLEATFKGQK